jgi:hypothetical protein
VYYYYGENQSALPININALSNELQVEMNTLVSMICDSGKELNLMTNEYLDKHGAPTLRPEQMHLQALSSNTSINGTQFENLVNAVLNGEHLDPDHEWYKGVMQMATYVYGSQQQVNLFRDITVDGQDYLMHGVLDYLRNGVVYDCKFAKKYHLNKYLDTTQTPVYLWLTPEARRMEYVVSDGEYLYTEKYPRDIVQPLEPIIRNFIDFCKVHNVYDILQEKWRVNE